MTNTGMDDNRGFGGEERSSADMGGMAPPLQQPEGFPPAPQGVRDDGAATDAPTNSRRPGTRIVYSEDGMTDREFERLLRENDGLPASKRQRTLDDEAQAARFNGQLQQETAWAVDFNAMGVGGDEEDLLPPRASETRYVQMRNYVLTKWREDVSRYLSEEAAMAALPYSCREYARTAWHFLDTAGYINFGVAPDILGRAAQQGAPKGAVIVIGAGLAGLAGAQHLKKLGYQPVVLEGHGRPGGRVYTKRLEAGQIAAVADLGGSILTGIDGNPLAVLAKQLRIPLQDIAQTEVPLYLADGSLPPKHVDAAAEADYNRVLDLCSRFRDDLGEAADHIALGTAMEHFWAERCASHAAASTSTPDPEASTLRQRLFEWHIANLEFANAASVKDLSVRSWDQDDPHELPGPHCFLPGGNIRLVAALTHGIDVIYNSRVRKVAYAADGVAVQTDTHVFKGDAVLVTVPLGVLKKGTIEFCPPLPLRKREAIKRLGFGLLNKMVLLFPKPFWGDADMFGRLAEAGAPRGEFYLFYSYKGLSGGAVLTALASGDAAARFEAASCEDNVRRVLEILRGIFGPKGIAVPPPLQACCTRWGADELAGGSYSSMAVGTVGGEDYDVLAESVRGRLFFAGEATTRRHPATMHGAFLSGQREAANISATLSRAEIEGADGAAFVQGLDAESGPQSLWEAREKASLAAFYAVQLEKVFVNPQWPPEIEFDCFAAVCGPPGGVWAQQALVRIDIGAANVRLSARHMHIFVVISRSDLHRLQDVVGGVEARFSLLASLPDVRLVGRHEISDEQERLLRAILVHRGLATRPPPGAAAVRAAAAAVVEAPRGAGAARQPVLPAADAPRRYLKPQPHLLASNGRLGAKPSISHKTGFLMEY